MCFVLQLSGGAVLRVTAFVRSCVTCYSFWEELCYVLQLLGPVTLRGVEALVQGIGFWYSSFACTNCTAQRRRLASSATSGCGSAAAGEKAACSTQDSAIPRSRHSSHERRSRADSGRRQATFAGANFLFLHFRFSTCPSDERAYFRAACAGAIRGRRRVEARSRRAARRRRAGTRSNRDR